MTLWQEIKALNPSRKDLQKFGWLVGGVFLAVGAWTLYRGKSFTWFLLIPGIVLFLAGTVLPASLGLVYRLWMGLAFVLGLIVSTILLTLFYFLVVTPIGLAARLFGQDFLSLKLDRHASSYWVKRSAEPPKPASYEQQF